MTNMSMIEERVCTEDSTIAQAIAATARGADVDAREEEEARVICEVKEDLRIQCNDVEDNKAGNDSENDNESG